MKTVWLINPYGPIEGENWRDYSFNQFAKYLSDNGYRVIWWTSNFAHHFKEYRSNGWADIEVKQDYIIRLVPTTRYKKNIGIGRVLKDSIFSYNCYRRMRKEKKPDLIITAETPLTFGYPGFIFGRKQNVPVIYDQMDLWPEFIEKSFGKKIGKILNVLFQPVYKNRKKNYESASGVIALAKNYLNIALDISKELKNKPHELIYNGIDVSEFRKQMKEKDENGIIPKKDKDDIWIIFAGTLGPSYDILTLLECAKRFNSNNLLSNRIRFIIAGSGPLENEVRNACNKVENIFYLGKLQPEQLTKIYNKCDIGLACYTAKSNVDMPDKFYDYTAANLAVVNSLNGEIKEYIEEYKNGINYEAGDVNSLYNCIEHICLSGDLDKLKNNSEKLAPTFDKNVQNEKLKGIIEKVLNNR